MLLTGISHLKGTHLQSTQADPHTQCVLDPTTQESLVGARYHTGFVRTTAHFSLLS